MSSLRWLYVSLALNAALLAALVFVWTRGTDSAVAPSSSKPALSRERLVPETAFPGPAAGPDSDSIDVASWIAQLRAVEVPSPVIAAAAAADFDRRWWRRQRELQRQFTRGEIDENTLVGFSDRHDQEQENALRAALGPELFHEWHQEKLLLDFERAGLPLSAGEAAEVYRVRTQHLAQLRQLEQARAEGLLDEAEFAENAAIVQQLEERQLEQVVGGQRVAALHAEPDELGSLRRQLRAAGATEGQAAAVIQAQQQWSQQRDALERERREGLLDDADYERRVAALAAARTEAQTAALGAEPFAAFVRAADPRHATLLHFAGAWGLAAEEVTAVTALLQSFDEQARAQRRAHAAVSPEADQAIRAVEREAERQLREVLGDERFTRMKRTGVLQLSE